MTIPIPGMKDIIDGFTIISESIHKHNKQILFDAWINSKQKDIFKVLTDYYSDLENLLFSYPQKEGNRQKVPLYVEPDWNIISNSLIKMHFKDNLRNFRPAKTQKLFWEFYRELKKYECNIEEWPLYDSYIFRLTKMDMSENELHLFFELGKFPDTIMCQYILEHELVSQLAKNPNITKYKFKLRDRIAANVQMIKSFFPNNVARIGISNLLLLKADKNKYIPMVQPRAGLSLVRNRLYHVVSSCIFEVATVAEADLKLLHTVLREIYEELFGREEVSQSSRILDPYFFYKEDGIADLLELLENGSATFKITGFCIDLVRIVPEITTLLVVNDDSYFRRHLNPSDSSIARFELNPEFHLGSMFRIPDELNDVDSYLCNEFIACTNDINKKGFDPTLWTLPGGYSFYQGLKRSVSDKLL